MPYEDGMQLVFDHVERTMVVSFRNTVKMIGPLRTRRSPSEQVSNSAEIADGTTPSFLPSGISNRVEPLAHRTFTSPPS